MRHALILLVLFSLTACVSPAGPATQPNEREWALLNADFQWLETVRNAQKKPAPGISRKERIELLLENHKKLEPTYVSFIDKVHEYYKRTSDPRAAALLAREKIILGDEYLSVLSRYDRAIELYRQAAEYGSPEAATRISLAESRRYVSMSAFANVKTGMKEDAVERLIGLPREDWIKQVVQKNRIYSVWIYPKSDGGASAVYFDNGVVYHTNWNAAAPSAGGAASR
jgi:hypothetical protein